MSALDQYDRTFSSQDNSTAQLVATSIIDSQNQSPVIGIDPQQQVRMDTSLHRNNLGIFTSEANNLQFRTLIDFLMSPVFTQS